VAIERVVLDTNVLVSAFLFRDSVPGQALRKARQLGSLMMSPETFTEVADVLLRPKFDRYLTVERRREILSELDSSAVLVEVLTPVLDCRDVADNKFLALALDGRADCIVSGDTHLLELHPWRGIPIVSARDFLDQTAWSAAP
jgi:putative PIN family toxin of toxin-antitoxin system